MNDVPVTEAIARLTSAPELRLPVARPCGEVREYTVPSAFSRAGMVTLVVCTRPRGHTGAHA